MSPVKSKLHHSYIYFDQMTYQVILKYDIYIK